MSHIPTYPVRQLMRDDAAAFRAIRLAALKDAPEAFGACHSIEEQWDLTQFADRIATNQIYAAFDENKIISTVGRFQHNGPKRCHLAELWGIYVAPEHRGNGLASRLMQTAISEVPKDIEQVLISVNPANTSAVDLYKRLGFEQYAYLPNALKVGGRRYDEIFLRLLLGKKVGSG